MDISRIKNVVVIGAGTMGVGIAQNFAQAGLKVKLADISREILDKSIAQIRANVVLFHTCGLIQENPQAILFRIHPVLAQSLEQALRNSEYVVEAIPEVLDAKRKTLARLEEYGYNGIIASNTSSFLITELVQGMKNPGRVIGVHFFNPAHIIPAVEVHMGESTTEEALEVTRQLMLKVGKKPVLVRKVLPGFIVNRLTGALEREIDHLLDEGVVTPEDLDTAIKASIGFRMACLGPQETEDMIGLDIALTVSNRVYQTLSNATGASPALAEKVKKGELGIKSGRGWYDYSGKTQADILDGNNRKLLRQLALFQARENDIIVDKRL